MNARKRSRTSADINFPVAVVRNRLRKPAGRTGGPSRNRLQHMRDRARKARNRVFVQIDGPRSGPPVRAPPRKRAKNGVASRVVTARDVIPVRAYRDGREATFYGMISFGLFNQIAPLLPLYERISLVNMTARYQPVVAVAHDGAIGMYIDPAAESIVRTDYSYARLSITPKAVLNPIFERSAVAEFVADDNYRNGVPTLVDPAAGKPDARSDLCTTAKAALVYTTTSYQGSGPGDTAIVGHIIVTLTAKLVGLRAGSGVGMTPTELLDDEPVAPSIALKTVPQVPDLTPPAEFILTSTGPDTGAAGM